MKQAILFIDTSDNQKISVGVQLENKKEIIEREIDTRKAQAVLPMVDEVLKKHGLSVRNLSSIEVFEGPGSYTGLRVGIAIANALSYSLKIPVNKRKIGEFAEPVYE